MHAQIITYQLKDISEAEYLDKMVQTDAPLLATIPGLVSKVWLSDPATNTYGGFYLWQSCQAMENFNNSDLLKAVAARPYLANITSKDYVVSENPTRITRGITLPSS